MSRRCVGGALTAALLATTNILAQISPPPTYPATVPTYPGTMPTYPASAPYYPPSSPTGELGAKNPLLLALVIQPLLQQSGASLSSGIGMLFSRFFNALFGRGGSAPNVAAQYPGGIGGNPGAPGSPMGYASGAAPYGATYPGTATYGTPGVPQYGTGYPQSVPSTPVPSYPSVPTTSAASPSYPSGYTGAQATMPAGGPAGAGQSSSSVFYGAVAPAPPLQGYAAYPMGSPTGVPIVKSGLLPSVIYTLNRLDPHTYKTTGQLDLTHGTPTLHTGDVFAIEYSTNVSGQVRIDNIDSQGQRSGLGTYTVLSGHDNRIPVTKGIKLVGTTGTETFKLYFYPCLATDSSGHPDAAAASASLPPCPTAPSPKLLQASKGLVAAKSAINLDSPDPTIAVSAVADYQASDVAENDFQLQHLAQE